MLLYLTKCKHMKEDHFSDNLIKTALGYPEASETANVYRRTGESSSAGLF